MTLAGRAPRLARVSGRALDVATEGLRRGEVRDVARRLNDLAHDDGVELVRLGSGAASLVRAVLDSLPPTAQRDARVQVAVKTRYVLVPGQEEPLAHSVEAVQVTKLSPENIGALLRALMPRLPAYADLRVRGVNLIPGFLRARLWVRQTPTGYVEQVLFGERRQAVRVSLPYLAAQTHKTGPIMGLTGVWQAAMLRGNETHRGMAAVRRCGRLIGWVAEDEPRRTHWRILP